jgi:hypothetical protein
MSAAEFVTPQRRPSKPTISPRAIDAPAAPNLAGAFLRAASSTLGVDFFRAYLIRPPLKWSDVRYVFDIKEDCNGKEVIQA